jgi:hypothetical protein
MERLRHRRRSGLPLTLAAGTKAVASVAVG